MMKQRAFYVAAQEVVSRSDDDRAAEFLNIMTSPAGIPQSFFSGLKKNNVGWMDDLFAMRRVAAKGKKFGLSEEEQRCLRWADEVIQNFLKPMFVKNAFNFSQIIWGQEDESVFQYIQRHEIVHPFQNVDDFKERAGTEDRLCFALSHKERPYLPLIYVVVALTRGFEGSISNIIGPEARHANNPDTATLYSIDNCEVEGLKGVANKLNTMVTSKNPLYSGIKI